VPRANATKPSNNRQRYLTIAVRSYRDLITAIVAVKNYLQLSDETIDTLAGLTRGHFDKIRSGNKKAGPMAIDALLGALAIELHVRPDPNQKKGSPADGSGATKSKSNTASRAPPCGLPTWPRSASANRMAAGSGAALGRTALLSLSQPRLTKHSPSAALTRCDQ
jgi:hypothetical protein